MKNLKFHTGRGGQFNNAGYVSFVGFENITEGMTFEKLMYDEENDKYLSCAGNELDYEINEDGTGYVNEDHDYDTTSVVKENNLDTKQVNALIRAFDSLISYWSGNSEIKRILNDYYGEYLD